MAGKVSLFGIRHHGPGSAQRLVEALDALQPRIVLIEGPADASDLLPMLGDPAMVPPVALLSYVEADPARVSFAPFAEYSPEYQAACWAVRHGAALRFIDLPAADVLAARNDAEPEEGEAAAVDPVTCDPIGTLARLAGYEDGESWWSDVIEENPAPGPVFAAVADAMAALRAGAAPPGGHEAAREAHMRLEIAKAAKEYEGPIAVVCGAWHVPALAERRPLAADRALLKGRPRAKVCITWAPWTAPRLARSSGYGAGVVAPGWCAHLWNTRGRADGTVIWLARIVHAMREEGHFVSVASAIEAQRLAVALAALRDRPRPGFAELADAVISCLCEGQRTRWDSMAATVLVGVDVGAIPASVPRAPLLEDLQRQQKATRLKPEALERSLAVDLRSDSGLARSMLLHRLNVLDVGWGRLQASRQGRNRGTFRENWLLCWQPEFAVQLVENLVHGATIEEAATTRLMVAMRREAGLGPLAELVRQAMVADLGRAVTFGAGVLADRAALTTNCQDLLAAIPPMAEIMRYGEARTTTAAHLDGVMPQMVVRAALALPYDARNLDAGAAQNLRQALIAADRGIALVQLEEGVMAQWRQALRNLLETEGVTRLLTGTAARMLYESDELGADATAGLMARMLSPGTPVAQAAGFFEGFFDNAGQRLIHDEGLRKAVDGWLAMLDEEAFMNSLPLFRRVFSGFDRNERRHLLDTLFARHEKKGQDFVQIAQAGRLWPAHEARVLALLDAGGLT
ncbi:DUF5682 family protein [Komagataeibacter europaeus]|uniref:DUF5682 family protein n=1 Tax=Komagataeibacter europaeus TaxID=33995 RepID=UPI0015FE31BC|nr:DUF5682 family protein [Komagataeibacter europaeus]